DVGARCRPGRAANARRALAPDASASRPLSAPLYLVSPSSGGVRCHLTVQKAALTPWLGDIAGSVSRQHRAAERTFRIAQPRSRGISAIPAVISTKPGRKSHSAGAGTKKCNGSLIGMQFGSCVPLLRDAAV